MSEEPKSCPFCGSTAVVLYEDKYYWKHPFVECKTCYARSDHDFTEEEVLKFWNTRPREQALEQALKEAREALTFYTQDSILCNRLKARETLSRIDELLKGKL